MKILNKIEIAFNSFNNLNNELNYNIKQLYIFYKYIF